MKSKRIIRFYFSADKLNRALDNLITAEACRFGAEEKRIERIIEFIEVKKELSRLWRYLDDVMSGIGGSERSILSFYGKFRFGNIRFSAEQRREIKRVVLKFRRRARFLERYGEGIKLVNEYYALL